MGGLILPGVHWAGVGSDLIFSHANPKIGTLNNEDLQLLPDGTGIVKAGALLEMTEGGRVYDDTLFFFGTGAAGISGWIHSTGQTNNTMMFAADGDNRALIFCQGPDFLTDFEHATPADVTLFIQSADPTNIGEFLGLSYLGLQADAMTTDKAAFDLTIAAVDAFASAVTNKDGGDLYLKGGSKVSDGVDGVVIIPGFTQLGSSGPKTREHFYTGTTGPNEGDLTSIAHGLADRSKIIGLQVLVTAPANSNRIPPAFLTVAEYEYDAFVEVTNISIRLSATNSNAITNGAITVVLTYQQ